MSLITRRLLMWFRCDRLKDDQKKRQWPVWNWSRYMRQTVGRRGRSSSHLLLLFRDGQWLGCCAAFSAQAWKLSFRLPTFTKPSRRGSSPRLVVTAPDSTKLLGDPTHLTMHSCTVLANKPRSYLSNDALHRSATQQPQVLTNC